MGNKKNDARSRLYKLGRNVFYVVNCEQSYIDEQLDRLIPHYEGQNVSEDEVIETKSGCSKNVADLFSYILGRGHHSDCAWVNATWLISPAGQKVLLVGKNAGRTTTALALAMGHGWKVSADDYFLVDFTNNKMVAYCTPFSFEPPTTELLHRVIGRAPDLMIQSQLWRSQLLWSRQPELEAAGEYDLKFDLAILLERSQADETDLVVSPVSASQVLMQLLQRSTLLKKGGVQNVADALASAACLRFSGGELEDRVAVILQNAMSMAGSSVSALQNAVSV
jgi:hypothetical protein